MVAHKREATLLDKVLDAVELDSALLYEEFLVNLERIDDFPVNLGDRFELPGRHHLVRKLRDDVRYFRTRRTAVGRIEFDAVIMARVVARSHVDGASGAKHLDCSGEFRSRHFATVIDFHAGLGELVRDGFAEFVTQQAVIVTYDHALLLEFGKVLHAERFKQFRSCFAVHANNRRTHDLEIAKSELRADFASPTRSTETHLSRVLRSQSDLFHLFNQIHVRSGVEFRGLNLFPNLGNVFHNGSCI